jgi:hypothetical protein
MGDRPITSWNFTPGDTEDTRFKKLVMMDLRHDFNKENFLTLAKINNYRKAINLHSTYSYYFYYRTRNDIRNTSNEGCSDVCINIEEDALDSAVNIMGIQPIEYIYEDRKVDNFYSMIADTLKEYKVDRKIPVVVDTQKILSPNSINNVRSLINNFILCRNKELYSDPANIFNSGIAIDEQGTERRVYTEKDIYTGMGDIIITGSIDEQTIQYGDSGETGIFHKAYKIVSNTTRECKETYSQICDRYDIPSEVPAGSCVEFKNGRDSIRYPDVNILKKLASIFLKKRCGDQLQVLSCLRPIVYEGGRTYGGESPCVFWSYDRLAIAFAILKGIPCVLEKPCGIVENARVYIYVPKKEGIRLAASAVSRPLGAAPAVSIPLGAAPAVSIPLGAAPAVSRPLGAAPAVSRPLGAAPAVSRPLAAPAVSRPLGAAPANEYSDATLENVLAQILFLTLKADKESKEMSKTNDNHNYIILRDIHKNTDRQIKELRDRYGMALMPYIESKLSELKALRDETVVKAEVDRITKLRVFMRIELFLLKKQYGINQTGGTICTREQLKRLNSNEVNELINTNRQCLDIYIELFLIYNEPGFSVWKLLNILYFGKRAGWNMYVDIDTKTFTTEILENKEGQLYTKGANTSHLKDTKSLLFYSPHLSITTKDKNTYSITTDTRTFDLPVTILTTGITGYTYEWISDMKYAQFQYLLERIPNAPTLGGGDKTTAFIRAYQELTSILDLKTLSNELQTEYIGFGALLLYKFLDTMSSTESKFIIFSELGEAFMSFDSSTISKGGYTSYELVLFIKYICQVKDTTMIAAFSFVPNILRELNKKYLLSELELYMSRFENYTNFYNDDAYARLPYNFKTVAVSIVTSIVKQIDIDIKKISTDMSNFGVDDTKMYEYLDTHFPHGYITRQIQTIRPTLVSLITMSSTLPVSSKRDPVLQTKMLMAYGGKRSTKTTKRKNRKNRTYRRSRV